MILLDTHVLLWLDRHPRADPNQMGARIGVGVRDVLLGSGHAGGPRGVDLWQSPESWRLDWLGAGLKEIALAQGATLVTADQAILSWPGPLQRHSAAG